MESFQACDGCSGKEMKGRSTWPLWTHHPGGQGALLWVVGLALCPLGFSGDRPLAEATSGQGLDVGLVNLSAGQLSAASDRKSGAGRTL